MQKLYNKICEGDQLALQECAKNPQAIGNFVFSRQIEDSFAQFLRVLLTNNMFFELYAIISYCQTTHNYCHKVYASVEKQNYTLQERRMDRFVEMLWQAQIERELYVPFFLYCYSEAENDFKDTAWEFLKKLAHEDFDAFYALCEQSQYAMPAFDILLAVNPARAVKELTDRLISQKGTKTELRLKLKPYKKQVIQECQEYLSAPEIFVRKNAISLLLLFKSDGLVLEILSAHYKVEQSKTIRDMIDRECNPNFDENKMRYAPHELEESFLRYHDGKKLAINVKRAFFTTFFDVHQIGYALEMAQDFLEEDLQALAHSLLDTKPQLCAIFGQEKQAVKAQKKLISIYEKSKNSEILTYLAYCGDQYKQVLAQADCILGLEVIAARQSLTAQDLLDECVPTFEGEFFTIDDSLFCFGAPAIKQELDKQIARMEQAFLTARRWSKQNFCNNILTHPILRQIAGTLFWAEYMGEQCSRVFIVHDGHTNDLKNSQIELNPNCKIGLVHPVELNKDDRHLTRLDINQPFCQIKRPCYYRTDEEAYANKVVRFLGRLVKLRPFLHKLKGFGWKQTPKTMQLILHGFLYELQYTVSGDYATLGTLSVYYVDKLPKIRSVYVTEGETAVAFENVALRDFSEVLLSIAKEN